MTIHAVDKSPSGILKEPIAYLLMRMDLPSMNPGKAMAQAFHAGNQLVRYWREISPRGEAALDYITRGRENGADFFNTCICLGATAQQIRKLFVAAEQLGYLCETVVDPSYPMWVDAELAPYLKMTQGEIVDGEGPKVLFLRQELTCGWFIGDKLDERFTLLFEGLDLHP